MKNTRPMLRRLLTRAIHVVVSLSVALLLASCSFNDLAFSNSASSGENKMSGRTSEQLNQAKQQSAKQIVHSSLPDLGEAPELQNTVWLNVDHPLRLAELRGKVVLLNFWTFECYNCRNVLPYVKQWNQTYAEQGLVTIGDHFPEFAYEADYNNLVNAVKELNIVYAVAQDNDGLTWGAYHQRFWPTIYLIDKQGHLRYQRIGEGAYDETEAAIKDLLAETY